MKILVTGGAGFIGSHLVDALIEKGHRVCVVDDLSTGLRENIKNGDSPHSGTVPIFYKIDIRDKKISNVFKKEKPDIVYHLASQINLRTSLENPVFDADVNILGSLNILENCRKYKVKKIIFSSTGGAIYGETKTIPTPETYPAQPPSPYGLSKLTVEKYLDIYYQQFGLNYAALRYANVYGPRQNVLAEAGVIAIFIKNMLDNKPCTINGSGRQTRDYVYVDDVVRANILAMEEIRGRTSDDKKTTVGVPTFNFKMQSRDSTETISAEIQPLGIYNVGTGIETSVNEVFKKIAEGIAMGKNGRPSLSRGDSVSKNEDGSGMTRGELGMTADHGPAIKGELQRSALSYEKIKKELRWQPEVDLDKGLKKTIKWFAKNK